MKKKNIFILIEVILAIGIMGTLAWWQWRSSINAQVFGQVCAPEMVFVGGTTINGNDLLPVRTKEEGLSKDIKVNLNNTCDNDTAVLNLILKPDVLPEGLSDPSFKWALYEVTTEEVEGTPTETLTYINDGNFNGKRQYVNDNDLISIATDLIVTENISTYRLFIYIDGLMDNPSTIGGNSFRFKLYGTGSGAIYNQYTMKQVSNSSATASFWGSPINANQVKSIRFIPTDQIPSQYTGTYDLSSVANSNDVTMYYVENGATTGDNPITLYDVYVASNNGMVVRANTSGYKMFAYLTNCEYIDAEGLDTSNITEMSNMFADSKMTEIKLSNWDTSKVTKMNTMFLRCSNLLELDLSNFNTSNVTVMNSNSGGMFQGCTSLEKIDLSSFDTSEVTDMKNMFNGCSSLTSLDVSSFDTSEVTDMQNMFKGCSSLTSLDVSSFDTSNVKTFSGMFQYCSELTSIDVSNFNISSLLGSGITYMFRGCSKIKELDLSNFVFNVTSFGFTFAGVWQIMKLDISGMNFSEFTGGSYFQVPKTAEIIVKDCTAYSQIRNRYGFWNKMHTVDGDYTCTV